MKESKCDLCYAPATKQCAKCSVVAYCSVQHQKLFWPIHKLNCELDKEVPWIVQPPLTKEENWIAVMGGIFHRKEKGVYKPDHPEPTPEEVEDTFNKASEELKQFSTITRNSALLNLREAINIFGRMHPDYTTWLPPLNYLPYYQNVITTESFQAINQLQPFDSIHQQSFREAFRLTSLLTLNLKDLPERGEYIIDSKKRLKDLLNRVDNPRVSDGIITRLEWYHLAIYKRVLLIEDYLDGTKAGGLKELYQTLFLDP